ncbi:phage tail protein, partial [Acinetobacter baumannii]|nr:phage tail protein [Acinetobacter baumannii]
PWGHFKTSFNTSVDANGFLKSASPVVKLFKDHIELNSDAEKQPIEFKKVDVGDYLLKGSLGFAQEGWYIEVPKDANGNTIVAVVYDT